MSSPRARKADRSTSGLRKIATLQTLANGSKPRQRQHMANRFARLENERARLERELETWERCVQATSLKLAKVNADIALLQTALLATPASHAVFRQGHSPRRPLAETQVNRSAALRNRAVTLEY